MATDDTRAREREMDERPAASGYFWSFWFTVRKRNWRVLVSTEYSLLSVRSDNTFRVHSLPSSRQHNVRFSMSLSVCYILRRWFLFLSPAWLVLHIFLDFCGRRHSTICPNSWCELNSKTSELCFGSFLLGYVAQPSRSSFQSVWLLSQLRWMQQVARECQDRHHSCLRLNGLGDSLASSHSFVRKSWKKTHGG